VLRSATIVAAIAFGAAAATFAVGLSASLYQVQATDSHGDVEVMPGRPDSGPPPGGGPRAVMQPPQPPDSAAVVAAITAQPGTAGYSGVAQTELTVAGLTEPVEILAFTGNDSQRGYRMVAGTWFANAGEIVVATPFLTATHTRVGDTIGSPTAARRSPPASSARPSTSRTGACRSSPPPPRWRRPNRTCDP
jgi:putative ABC transport system permease protein